MDQNGEGAERASLAIAGLGDAGEEVPEASPPSRWVAEAMTGDGLYSVCPSLESVMHNTQMRIGPAASGWMRF
ncbi:hypothetical protein PG997_015352 [Apiospora hydei]|uniref:Uncharacterized protein n=1 Tax=Apiospora hydei TaxID=1337664 RepID=A0ABR1USW5_9PEZI